MFLDTQKATMAAFCAVFLSFVYTALMVQSLVLLHPVSVMMEPNMIEKTAKMVKKMAFLGLFVLKLIISLILCVLVLDNVVHSFLM